MTLHPVIVLVSSRGGGGGAGNHPRFWGFGCYDALPSPDDPLSHDDSEPFEHVFIDSERRVELAFPVQSSTAMPPRL